MYAGQKIVLLNARDKSAYTHPVQKWAVSQRGALFCAECHAPKREIYPAPIDVYLCQPPKPKSYSTVFGAGVGVIHDRLFDVLRSYLPGHVCGRCFWEDGAEVPEQSSIYFPDTIVVRGCPDWPWYEPNAICGTCGTAKGATAEELYVLRREMPGGEVFQDWGSEMYLADDVARRFPWKQFRDLEPLVIEVRDEPYPGDPVPVRPFKPRPISGSPPPIGPISAPAFVPEPPRYADLKSMSPEFARLEEDSWRSCPVPTRQIMRYLRLEMGDGCPRAKELEFLRTAQIGDRVCWIWRFGEQVEGVSFVTVWRYSDGTVTIGYRGNTADLTPEQYIYGEHHELL